MVIENWGLPAQPWFRRLPAVSGWAAEDPQSCFASGKSWLLVMLSSISISVCPFPGHHATTNCMQDPTFFLPRPIKLQCLLGVSTGCAYDTCCGLRALAMGSWWRFQRSSLPHPPGRRLLARLKCSWQTSFSMLRKQLWCLQEYYSRPESSDLSPTCTRSGE